MKIVVTGGAGFIGSHVADALLARGDEVLVIDDLSSGRRTNVPKGARFEELDIRRGDAVRAVFEAFRPDAVCHQAAQTSVSVSTREPVRDAEINVIGMLHVLEAAAATKVSRVVFASTGGAIYGEIPDGKKAQLDWEPKPLSPYACSKFAGEAYLRRYQHERGLGFTVLRYSNVYGPRQDPHGEAGVVAIFSERVLRGEPIKVNARKVDGDDGCVRDYVFVDDVVRANLRALSGEITLPIVNVATGVATTTLELARRIEAASGKTANIGRGPRRDGDVEHSLLEPTPMAFGGPTTSLEVGIQKTVAWFQAR